MPAVLATLALILALTAVVVGAMALLQLKQVSKQLATLDKQLVTLDRRLSGQEKHLQELQAKADRPALPANVSALLPMLTTLLGAKKAGLTPTLVNLGVQFARAALDNRKKKAANSKLPVKL